MAEFREINSLEEQLREDRRLAAVRRRKRRRRWLIPLLLLAAALGVWLWFYFAKNAPPEEKPLPTETAAPANAAVELAFVGDIALDGNAVEAFRTEYGFDFSPVFRRIITKLTSADLTVGNLEGNVTDDDAAGSFCYPRALLQSLYECGFDVLQTANSYSIQNGITGLARTCEEIRLAGMEPVGTCATQEERDKTGGVLIREVNGLRLAFVAFTKGVNNLRLPEGAEHCVNLLYTDYDTNYSKIDRAGIRSVLENAKLAQPDVIIALVHWGSEYTEDVSAAQKQVAELMFDEGVNLIVGSHSHYVGPMELRDPRIEEGENFIAYGLGDFLSAADTTAARNGCILSVRIEKRGGECTISKVEYTPTFSAAPSDALDVSEYEILDSLDAISFYERGYYNRISSSLYKKLTAAVERMREQTGCPQYEAKKDDK